MREETLDALVVGGGMAGLALTAQLAADGRRVACVDAGPRPGPEAAENDRRVTAVLMPGVDTLRRTGAWDAIEPRAAPMLGLRVLDCGGAHPIPREDVTFEAAEIRDGPFGWSVENAKARAALADAVDDAPGAEAIWGTRVIRWLARRDAVIATLSDGRTLRAKVICGVDGKRSATREAAGIGHRRTAYGQKAIACRVTHERDHEGISIEMHHVGGPLTFAPLPGRASGVVWMNPDRDADRLIALDDEGFLRALQESSQGIMGTIRSVEARAHWPMETVVANAMHAPRCALLGEAAHAFPPIGAQGFNLSLRDVESFAEATAGAADMGEAGLLGSWARSRGADVWVRALAVDALNRSVRTSLRPVRDLRRAGLGLLGRFEPLRRGVMRFGMGG